MREAFQNPLENFWMIFLSVFGRQQEGGKGREEGKGKEEHQWRYVAVWVLKGEKEGKKDKRLRIYISMNLNIIFFAGSVTSYKWFLTQWRFSVGRTRCDFRVLVQLVSRRFITLIHIPPSAGTTSINPNRNTRAEYLYTNTWRNSNVHFTRNLSKKQQRKQKVPNDTNL